MALIKAIELMFVKQERQHANPTIKGVKFYC